MTNYLKLEVPPPNIREIERYARGKDDIELSHLVDECLGQCEGVFNFNIGFCELNFTIKENLCDFDTFSVCSEALSRNIFDAKKVFLFVASIGHGIDRLIAKYSRTSPLKALLFNAIGTERVEALSDAFVAWLEKETSLKSLPRFSAGYGDLPLEVQKNVFDVLKPENQIGVFLSESFVMSPSKSVTAIIGVK